MSFKYLEIIGKVKERCQVLRGCVAITLKRNFVILNGVKNLIRSMCYETEILRLGPQNDIATQPPDI
ncbi:MAG: hypothetical protein COV68_03615 [Nitrospirae bacterium CG11_big_fil_rev_8_21_14_0_20_41_14]|nr:MAG: hypothetical protein COV68_03615 [Nitrospirae bacterium CG11_big_fil_rev_8_21_14_0_20_41_14]